MAKSIHREALLKIYNFLLTKLTPENKEWLKKHHEEFWRNENDFTTLDITKSMTPITTKSHYYAGVFNKTLTISIEDMINAIRHREAISAADGFNYQVPLTTDYLGDLQIYILQIHKDSKNKEELLQLILSNIP